MRDDIHGLEIGLTRGTCRQGQRPSALPAGWTVRDHLCKDIGDNTLVFGQRFRDRGFKGGRIDDLYFFTRAVTPLEVAQLADGHSLADALA